MTERPNEDAFEMALRKAYIAGYVGDDMRQSVADLMRRLFPEPEGSDDE